uniref:Uncharacterized protein n=1 Tax=Erwinia amylovora ATCC BAA-2158 TaxID=889211 RepID=E5B8T4_ERWAM|nr:hypothetical protein EAIL5_3069 [Erwinia amylovora ATCC BAA-2158]
MDNLGVFFRLAVAVEDLLRAPPRLVIVVVLAVVTGVSLEVLDGCLLPIPDSREERRLRTIEQQLKAQQQDLEQAKRRIKTMLA